jgi:hypothetical protein
LCRSGAAWTFHLAGVGLVDVLGEDGRGVLPAEAGTFGVVFDALLEGADEVLADDLVILLAHLGIEAEEVLEREVFHRGRDLGRIDRAGLVHRRLQIFEDGAEAGGGEVELVLFAETLGEGFGFLVADGGCYVFAERHHRQHAVVAAGADRGRAAGEMRIEGVVVQVGAGIDAGLDQEVHVRAPVAGQQRLRARGLDLGDVGREVLDLAERDQFVTDDLNVRPQLGEVVPHLALHRLAEQVILVDQVDLGGVLWQRADHHLGLHAGVQVEAEMPEAALLIGELRRHRTAVQIDDAVVGVALVVLVGGIDQRGGDVGAAALHDEGHVLVGGALQRDQRVRGLRLVVERDQFELLAERAALRIDVVDDVLHLLQVGVADLRERA